MSYKTGSFLGVLTLLLIAFVSGGSAVNQFATIFVVVATWAIMVVMGQRSVAMTFIFVGYINPFGIHYDNQIISLNLIFLGLLILTYIISKGWKVPFGYNKSLVRLILIFFAYQVLISTLPNLITKGLSVDTFLTDKSLIYGILFFFPGYYVGLKGGKQAIFFLVIFSLSFFAIYFLSYFNVLHVIEFKKQYLVAKEGVTRDNFQLSQTLKIFIYMIPLSLTLRLRNRIIFMFLGFAGIISLLIMVLRTEIIYTSIGIIFSLFVFKRYVLLNRRKKQNIFFFIILIFPILILLGSNFTNVFDNAFNAFHLTLGNANTIQSSYSFYHRFFQEVPNQISLLTSSLKNILFGSGFIDLLHKNTLTPSDLGVWDVPITGALLIYGIIGFMIYLFIYRQIFLKVFEMLKSFKEINVLNNMVYVVYLGLGVYFITAMIFRGFYSMWELVQGNLLVEFYFLLGFLSTNAYYRKLKSAVKTN